MEPSRPYPSKPNLIAWYYPASQKAGRLVDRYQRQGLILDECGSDLKIKSGRSDLVCLVCLVYLVYLVFLVR